MSSSHAEPARRWSLTARLTALYTAATFTLLLAAALFLYWELDTSLHHDAQDRLQHKVQVLARLIHESPPNLPGIRQETSEEAEVSARSAYPFFLRVLDSHGHALAASHDMAIRLPSTLFQGAPSTRTWEWQAPSGAHYLLASATAATAAGEPWSIHAAFDVSVLQPLLQRFRQGLLLMLLAGLVFGVSAGRWVVQRGLKPLQAMAAMMEPIGATELSRRIAPARWPVELQGVAAAFDRVLDRLQDSFVRLQQFSADLAHELRTPINNLMGEAQVALSRPRTPPEYERVLQSSLEELLRLTRMIDSMLFLAQADQARLALHPAPLQALAELRAVVDFYEALAEEQGVTVALQGEAPLLADPLLVRRALGNLLSNALKHTPRGGFITLRAHPHPDHTTLTVCDTGTGIPPQHHARLGDRFFRVEDARRGGSGHGLGLAIVRSIMNLHGGSMHIDSEPGRGTCVTLRFPARLP